MSTYSKDKNIMKTIRINQMENDNWDINKIHAFLEGETVDLDLIDRLVLLMVKAGVNSEVYGIDIKESEIQSNINRLTESGKIG
ncbi:MAG TPA: hypothetical protein VMZ91_00590 [Candidatus Paceibacterota bacterium]|nr:hypothetical protein [Candidatus Paceibacterota bacterium]